MIGYGQLPPLVVTLWCWEPVGSVKLLSRISTSVPEPATLSVPWPERTPSYVVVPEGRFTTESPRRAMSRPASN